MINKSVLCGKNFLKLFVCVLFSLSMVVAMPLPLAQALTTHNQKGDALKKYDVKKYKTVKNKNFGKLKYKFKGYGLDTTAHSIKVKKGAHKGTKFVTWAYLPKSYDGSGDMGNPQAIAVMPDAKTAYISYAATAELKKKFKLGKNKGRIVRYDLEKLEELGANIGDMSEFATASRMRRNAVRDGKDLSTALTQRQQDLLSCVTFGPWINMGHGSAMGYDRKRNALWLSSKTSQIKTNLIRINIDTLKPVTKYNFTLKSTVPMGNNLVFDKRGRCYFYSHSQAEWAPKGSIKIYQGKIGSKSVKFRLIMQGVKNSPSKNVQTIGYNPKSNRLYFVSNGTAVSVPVKKLGKLKKSDVKTSLFSGKREFEGLAFDKTGKSYLLVNKDPEIMVTDPGF